MHPRDEMVRILQDIDDTEADLVRLQSRLWSVRRRLQEIAGKKVGHQYEEASRELKPDNADR